jgi:hypothetical protein
LILLVIQVPILHEDYIEKWFKVCNNDILHGAIQMFLKYTHINKNYYVLPESYSAPSPSK